MLLRIAAIMAPLAAIVVLGWLYARRAQPDLAGANKLVVDLCLPALVFTSLSTKPIVFGEQWPFLAAAVAVILGSGLLAWPIARWAQADPRAFLPTVMFGNVGPIGIPISLLSARTGWLRPCCCSCCRTCCTSPWAHAS
jgi:malate permease and related proteins